MAETSLTFDLLARDRASQAFANVGRSADGLGSKLAGVGRIAATAIAGAAVGAVAGLGAAMVQGVRAAVSYETLAKKTAAVLVSTGNAANTTVDGIQNLAGKLESLSGVDEELIINSQNVLATFTKIRNVGQDRIFDQATKSALDMSVALGQDLQGATTMVGKALNDPIAGISAMSRAGVQFTQQQKDQIKALVESGDVLGAQKVILGELETQFGGTAKAAGSGFAGDLARLKDALDDAFRNVGVKILPYLADLAGWLSQRLPAAIDATTAVFGRIAGVVQEFWYSLTTGFTEDEGTPVERFALRVRDVLLTMADVARQYVVPAIGAVGDFVSSKLLPPLQAVGRFVAANIIPVLGGLAAAFAVLTLAGPVGAAIGAITAVVGAIGTIGGAIAGVIAAGGGLTGVLGVLGSVVTALISPVVLVAGAIAALVAGAIYAYTHFEGFRKVVDAVASAIRDGLGAAVSWLAEVFTTVVLPAVQVVVDVLRAQLGNAIAWVVQMWPQISEAAGRVWAAVQGIVSTAMTVIGAAIDAGVAVIRTLWNAFGDELLNVVQIAWDTISSVVNAALDFLRGIIQTVLAVINGDWGKAWDGVKMALGAVWDAMYAIVEGALRLLGQSIEFGLSALRALWDTAWAAIGAALSAVWDGIKAAVSGALDFVKGRFDDAVEFLRGIPRRIGDALATAWDRWKELVTGAKDWVVQKFDEVVGFVTGLPGRIASAASGMWDGIKDGFRSALNWIIERWNNLSFKIGGGTIDMPGPLPSLDIPEITLNTPNLPRFASGGVVPGPLGAPVLAVVHGGEEVLTQEERAARTGAPRFVAQFGDVYLADAVDVDMLAQRLEFRLQAGAL